MENRQSPIHWSFSCGTWAGTDVRISFFVPLLILLIGIKLGDFQLALAVGLIYLISILIHEAAHIFAVRATGGTGDEILVWPLGGLASVYPANSFRSQFLTPAAGPISNLLICLVVLFPVIQSPYWPAVFNPLVFPVGSLSREPFEAVLVITFWVNYLLMLLNLIPVYPLDGGRMVLAVLKAKFAGDRATQIYIKVGCFAAIIGMIGGYLAENTTILLFAAVVLVLNLQESFMLQKAEGEYDDSFMGYDFSQGYTSLERDEEEDEPRRKPERRPGFLQRWRQKRKEEKERVKREQDAELQAELDQLLEKIQQGGMESLTDAERRKLDRAAALFKEKERGQAEM